MSDLFLLSERQLARPASLTPQPRRQLLGKRVQFARPVRHLKLQLNLIRPKVFADRVPRHPSRREISRIGTCSHLCHRRIMLKNAMSNTPFAPANSRRGNSQTWVKSQWKNPAFPGHFSAEINRHPIDAVDELFKWHIIVIILQDRLRSLPSLVAVHGNLVIPS